MSENENNKVAANDPENFVIKGKVHLQSKTSNDYKPIPKSKHLCSFIASIFALLALCLIGYGIYLKVYKSS